MFIYLFIFISFDFDFIFFTDGKKYLKEFFFFLHREEAIDFLWGGKWNSEDDRRLYIFVMMLYWFMLIDSLRDIAIP